MWSISSTPKPLVIETLGSRTADEIYMTVTTVHSGHPPTTWPAQDKHRASLIIRYFNAIATTAERTKLSGKMENGARWNLVQKLQSELSGYMASVYRESEEAVPRQLKKTPYPRLSGSTIETFRSKLKVLAHIDSSKMAAFRKKTESGDGGSSGSGGGGGGGGGGSGTSHKKGGGGGGGGGGCSVTSRTESGNGGGGGKSRPVMPKFGAMKLGELNKFALEKYGMSGFKRQQIAVTNVTKCWVEAQKKTEAEEEGQQQPPPKRRKVQLPLVAKA